MSLIKNSSLNLFGYIIPAIVSIPAFAYLARVLELSEFGAFTLIIAILGFSGLFDAGISRAIIREIAIYKDDDTELSKIISTASSCSALLGCVFIFTAFIVSLICYHIKPDWILSYIELIICLLIIIPIFLLTQVWMAILEGKQDFLRLNIQKSITSSFIQVMPAIFVLFEPCLISACYGLLFARALALVVSLLYVKEDVFNSGFSIDKKVLKRFFSFGLWVTVSNIISPVMVYFDRFILSIYSGAVAVAKYSAPSELIGKINVIPISLARALYPKISNTTSVVELKKIESNAYFLCLVGVFPISIFIFFFSESILVTWLGVKFEGEPAYILQVLVIGFVFNSFAQIPFASLQASGHARLTALVHLFEVLPYLTLLVYLVEKLGALGAAYAWSIRVSVDWVVLQFLSRLIINEKNNC